MGSKLNSCLVIRVKNSWIVFEVVLIILLAKRFSQTVVVATLFRNIVHAIAYLICYIYSDLSNLNIVIEIFILLPISKWYISVFL